MTGSSGTKYSIDKQIGEGGQGYVFLVQDESKNRYAMKWYKKSTATESQKEIIISAISNKPNHSNEDINFIWPFDLVEHKKSESFGYIMPLYDTKNFINYNKVINAKVKKPSLKTLSYISYLIAEALEVVHKNGMAYCDINLGNIQFDFNNQKISVCDNDNVVINNSNVNVLGVPEFMAPEVALKKSHPNMLSDLYSLSILFYMLWTYEHPMEGSKTENIRCWDLVAKKKFYHEEPVFVHNPNEQSNSIENSDIYKLSLAQWKYYLSNRCKKAFIKTFTEGISRPEKRTKTNQWKNIFLEMYDNAISCPYCSAENIFDPMQEEQTCLKCKKVLPFNKTLEFDVVGNKMEIVLRDQMRIFPYHFGEIQEIRAQSPIAQIEPHPKKRGAYIIRNLSDETWKYKVGEDIYTIEPQKARALIPNGVLEISGIKVKVKERK
jgi:serine/threonine protein kinase